MEEDLIKEKNPQKILYITFNYDSSYFLMGTDIGFQIYQTFPLSLKISRQFNGGISLIKMLNKTNIFCLVGGGSSPMFTPNKLILWDDKKFKILFEQRFISFILDCHIKANCSFIICADFISIINMKNLKIISTINTINNPRGISSISSNPDKYILGFPDVNKGKINVAFFPDIENDKINIKIKNKMNNIENNKEKEENCFDSDDDEEKNKIDLFNNIKTIQAHESNICTMCLNKEGTKIATASDRGTLVRIFDTQAGNMVQEFRRGSGDAVIYSICFSFDNNYIGLTSDHGTAHIFNLNKEKPGENKNVNNNNNSSGYNMMSYINQNYLVDISKKIGFDAMFSSEFSFAQFKVPYKEKSLISFNKDKNKNVFVIDKSGNYITVEVSEYEEPKILKKTKVFKVQ